MDYNRIISVTGLGGLYELLGSKADGAIVRSLEDNHTQFVSSRSHNFSHLESIEVYTIHENVNLVEVFKAMQESKEALPDEKNVEAVKAYFQKVYPDMDFERVYNSDRKKMVKWFKIIRDNKIALTLESSAPTEEPVAEKEEEAKSKAAEAEKPAPKKAKKAAPKKTATEKKK